MAPEITEYHARTASADVDTIEICQAFPDFMIYGTYSLAGRDREYDAQIRKGTIEVIPVSHMFQPAYPGMLLPKLSKKTFPAAVLDIRFHPKDKTLLGVALSNGHMHFFRFLRRGDVLGRRIITELLSLGHVVIGTADEHGLIPLITQFIWLPSIKEVNRRDVSNILSVSVAATLSSHEVKIIKLRIPGIRSTNDPRLARAPAELPVLSEDIHSHDLEAWTVSSLSILEFDGNLQHILLSGGDDSKLMASMVEQDNCSILDSLLTSPPVSLWSNRKIYAAGVTSILPLSLPVLSTHDHPSATPLLTGSYDESIYLHTLAPHTYRPALITSLSLRGGVWRLKLMDAYTLPLAHPPSQTNIGPASRLKDIHQPRQTNYIILVSCMHAGAQILKVTYTPSSVSQKSQKAPVAAAIGSEVSGNNEEHGHANRKATGNGSEDDNWAIKVEATFTRGHETLVYCCDFRREWAESDETPPSNSTSSSTTSVSRGLSHELGNVSLGKTQVPIKDGGHLFGRSGREKVKDTLSGGEGQVGLYTVVSTSFYDRQVCVWRWKDAERVKGKAL